jgi:hypothetical protein
MAPVEMGAFGPLCRDVVGIGGDGMDGVSLEGEDGWGRKRVCSFELIQRYFETTGLGSYSIPLFRLLIVRYEMMVK